eukprot:9177117-Lingulodinium_polyedra.AAC.1
MPGAAARTTLTRSLATICRTANWAPWRALTSLETLWHLRGGPRCPLAVAESSAIAALLAARLCGPLPHRRDTNRRCNELLAYATTRAHGDPRDPDVKDAIT